jgi:pentatricopeptide repeat protein
MKPSTELFDLIKSLTKSEKRFFKLSSSLQSGDKNYLKLFDEIEKMDEYDEDHLKKVFKKESFVKHLPSEKNHLYKTILKSLRSFHSDRSVSSVLRQEIKNIEILFFKALYKECGKFIARAKKTAYEYEKFYYLFELINLEKMLLEEAIEFGQFDTNLNELIEEELDVINKLRNLAEYQMLYSKINYLYRSGGFARNETERKEVEAIANHPLIQGKNTALSIRAASICYYIQGLCAATNRDFDLSYVKFLKVKTILDTNPKIKEDLPKRYIRAMKNLLYCYIENSRLDEAEELISEMRELVNEKGFDNTDSEVKIFTASYIAELLINDRRGDFSKSLAVADDIVEGMEKYGEKINKEQSIVFYYNLAYVYFGNEEYNKALKWVNMLLNDNEQKLRQDIYNFARFFNLVIHYELQNFELIEYLLKSTNRYLKKHEKEYQSEQVILKYFRKLAKTHTEISRVEVFKEFKTQLEKLMENPKEQVILQYFDFTSWIDSKIKRIPLSDAIKQRHN